MWKSRQILREKHINTLNIVIQHMNRNSDGQTKLCSRIMEQSVTKLCVQQQSKVNSSFTHNNKKLSFDLDESYYAVYLQ